MIERLDRESVETRRPLRRVRRVREDSSAFAEHRRVEADYSFAQRDVFIGMREITEWRACQFIGGAMLMDEPGDLVWMAREVRRELGGNDEIDRPPVAFREVQQAPRTRVRENFGLRVPLERHADQLSVIPVQPELADQLTDMVLSTAADKRHLGFADENRAQDRADAITRYLR